MSDLMATHVRPQCPGDDVLAAYLDDRLTPDERRAVEEHVASCEDCRTLLADSVLALEALDLEEQETEDAREAQREPDQQRDAGDRGEQTDKAERTALPFRGPEASARTTMPAPTRAPRLWPAIGLLAAAALALFVFRDPLLDAVGFGPARARANAQAELIAAAAEHRTFEPRLAGGFPHAPVQGVMRSGSPAISTTPDITIATARIAQLAARDHSVEAQTLLGASRLIGGEIDGAIDALEAASRVEPPRASVMSDLAAAYYVRAERTGRIDDYTRAFDAAKGAVALNPNLPEARFNLALATERTQTPADARLAWEAYLQQDPSSPWSEEARKHLANLPR